MREPALGPSKGRVSRGDFVPRGCRSILKQLRRSYGGPVVRHSCLACLFTPPWITYRHPARNDGALARQIILSGDFGVRRRRDRSGARLRGYPGASSANCGGSSITNTVSSRTASPRQHVIPWDVALAERQVQVIEGRTRAP